MFPGYDDETMQGKVAITMRGMQAIEDLNTATRHAILEPGTVACDFKGRTYYRVTCTTSGGTQTMVEFFVDKNTGDVLKGSWQRPESKEARFNISTPDGRARLFRHMLHSRHGYLYKDNIKAVDAL